MVERWGYIQNCGWGERGAKDCLERALRQHLSEEASYVNGRICIVKMDRSRMLCQLLFAFLLSFAGELDK